MTRREVKRQSRHSTMAAPSKDSGRVPDSVGHFSSEELILDSESSDSSDDSDLDNNNNIPPSPILDYTDRPVCADSQVQGFPRCSRTMATAAPDLKSDSLDDSAGYASSRDSEEQDESRCLRTQDTDGDETNPTSVKKKISEENSHYKEYEIQQLSDASGNSNNSSNKKKLRRRSSDFETNNNNLLKPRSRSVQLSSIRAGSGMRSRTKLKPYMSRMIAKDGSINIRVKNHGKMDMLSRYTRDIYTTIVDLNIVAVLFLTALVYLGQWLSFGLLYHIFAIYNGDTDMHQETNVTQSEPCVSNVYDFVSAFLFSMESETTIGYGSRSMGVVCPWAVTSLVVQCVLSAIFDTWVIGMCYAKFASPYLRTSTLEFAKNAVICTRDGKRCLIIRVANLRKSLLLNVSCRARIITLREARRRDGNDGNLQQDELELTNSNSIMLTAPMEYCHVIDKKSPLHSISQKYFESEDKNWFELVVFVSGVIEATGMALQAQTSYLSSEIKYKHRFARILSESEKSDRYIVNFKRFHDTEPEPFNSSSDVPTYVSEIVTGANRKYKPLPETLEEEETDEVFDLPGV